MKHGHTLTGEISGMTLIKLPSNAAEMQQSFTSTFVRLSVAREANPLLLLFLRANARAGRFGTNRVSVAYKLGMSVP